MRTLKQLVIKLIQNLAISALVACGIAFLIEKAAFHLQATIAEASPLPPLSLDEVIESEAQANRISADLVRGVIQQESNWNPDAMSNQGAIGLMQVTLPTAKSVCGIDSAKLLFNPKLNAQCGIKILALHLHDRGSVIKALREYNGGYKCISGGCRESEDYWPKVINFAATS